MPPPGLALAEAQPEPFDVAPAEVVPAIGETAARGYLALVPNSTETSETSDTATELSRPVLTANESQVLIFHALGGKPEQVEKVLKCDLATEEEIQTSILEKLEARSMANAVHKAVIDGILPVPDRSRGYIPRVSQRRQKLIRFMAEGLSNSEIGTRFGKDQATIATLNRPIFKLLRANTRAHIVYRAHEYGYL